ncbi:hypothetical protein AVEN_232852-1 [Araneus ventricosus]|uniref:Uncharacterized protein n=1 Tax=Araneus ventricosus TaxID=182803 RepID=A0A4Y2RAS1_ARAVE|nr:hypothetical protein AVEN_232852-1 [Araneus ventricosus]
MMCRHLIILNIEADIEALNIAFTERAETIDLSTEQPFFLKKFKPISVEIKHLISFVGKLSEMMSNFINQMMTMVHLMVINMMSQPRLKLLK